MVAVIKFSSSLRNVLNYNENKLKQNKAEFIHSSGYGSDTEKLGYSEKFKRLQKQMLLRPSWKKSVAHISLNFDRSEKLDKETLRKIADTYMQRIGFAYQPYLVYQHHDAGHPHIHIVSTIIKNDGGFIETHNIGKKFSEPTRLAIEKEFGLIVADKHRQREVIKVNPVNVQKVMYGKSETKRAITNVLDHILPYYKYTSLAELNALLGQYNVLADQGTERSRIQKNKGLVYRVLDEKGNKVGVPIKASDIYSNPGLKYLEERFSKNESLRQPFKQRIKNAVDLAFTKRPVRSVAELKEALMRDKIHLVVRRNADGVIYGLTYIDHDKKCVFNGSDLGKQYSANAIQQRLNAFPKEALKNIPLKEKEKVHLSHHQNTEQQKFPATTEAIKQVQHPELNEPLLVAKNILHELTEPEKTPEYIPHQLKQKRKRKRKRLHL